MFMWLFLKTIFRGILSPIMTWRFWLHFPLGIATALLFSKNLPVACAFTFGFIVYEINEDRHCHDKAYLDLYGWLAGLMIVGFCF